MSATLVCQEQDCGALFTAKNSLALYCPKCKVARRRRYQHEYEHGKRRGTCMDCGTEIGARALRCRVCDNISRSERYTGVRNPNWKEGRRTDKGGYIYVRVQEGSPGKGKGAFYRGEHTIAWEQTHGKPLPKGWVVHHLNGVKDDNRPQNLLGLPRQEHHSQPREVLKLYERRILELEKELNAVQQLKLLE